MSNAVLSHAGASRRPPSLAAALGCALLGCAAVLVVAPAALAHPHVWVTARAQVVYEGGKLAGVRNTWRFDPEYTAFITQGLDANGDGRLSPDELAGLARENTANLSEFGYFTKLKVAGREQPFADPREPEARVENGGLVMTFLLPLKAPVPQGRGVAVLEVYDPTFFVDFSFAEGQDAATVSGAPQGCAATLTRPKAEAPKTAGETAQAGQGASGSAAGRMGEAFFEALTASANYGQQFAGRVLVACP